MFRGVARHKPDQLVKQLGNGDHWTGLEEDAVSFVMDPERQTVCKS